MEKIRVRLPTNPKEEDYEDFTTACLIAHGFFTEPRLTLKQDSTEVLELDVLATPSGEGYADRKLIEVKSGETGFPDLFKIYGWIQYLQISEGLLVRKKAIDDSKQPALERFRKRTNVSCCHLDPVRWGNFVLPSSLTIGADRQGALLRTAWLVAELGHWGLGSPSPPRIGYIETGKQDNETALALSTPRQFAIAGCFGSLLSQGSFAKRGADGLCTCGALYVS